jgi:integrase
MTGTYSQDKEAKKKRIIYAKDELVKMLAYLKKQFDKNGNTTRPYYILLFACCTGIRASEFAQIKFDDIIKSATKSAKNKTITMHHIKFV